MQLIGCRGHICASMQFVAGMINIPVDLDISRFFSSKVTSSTLMSGKRNLFLHSRF